MNRIKFLKSTFFLPLIFFAIYGLGQCSGQVDKYYNYTLSLIKKKNYNGAYLFVSKGIKKYPNSVKLIYLRAKINHGYREDYYTAIRDYTRALKIDPYFNAKAYWRRGQCLYNISQYTRALKDYNRCLKLKPDYNKVFIMRAKAYAKLGLFNKAKTDLEYVMKHHKVYADHAKQLYFSIVSKGISFDNK